MVLSQGMVTIAVTVCPQNGLVMTRKLVFKYALISPLPSRLRGRVKPRFNR